MTFKELIDMTRFYTRDSNGFMFSDTNIKLFINQGIDRIKQFKLFSGLSHLDSLGDIPQILPQEYHYMLALFSASRLFDNDERFYEATQKRNEFEQLFEEMISEINAGNIIIKDANGDNLDTLDDGETHVEYVKDEYYSGTSTTGGDEL